MVVDPGRHPEPPRAGPGIGSRRRRGSARRVRGGPRASDGPGRHERAHSSSTTSRSASTPPSSRSPDYRDSKVDTTLATIPQGARRPTPSRSTFASSGLTGEPHRRRAPDPDLEQPVRVHPRPPSGAGRGSTPGTWASCPWRSVATRRRPRSWPRSPPASPSVSRGSSRGRRRRSRCRRAGPIDVGLDGETLSLDPPLTFSMRPAALRVRLPIHAIGYSPAARAMGWRDAARTVWRTALGRRTLPSPTGASPGA